MKDNGSSKKLVEIAVQRLLRYTTRAKAEHMAKSVLTAIKEAGYAVVPREPAEAMLDKGEYINSECLNDNAPIGQRMYREPAKSVYRAMITAGEE